MIKNSDNLVKVSAQPRFHQHGREIQSYGTVRHSLRWIWKKSYAWK